MLLVIAGMWQLDCAFSDAYIVTAKQPSTQNEH